MRAVLVMWSLLHGCGRLGFDPTERANDAQKSCGESAPFADDFEDGTIDARWEGMAAPGMTLREQTGALEIGLASDEPEVRYTDLHSVATFDLRGCRVAAEVVQTVTATLAVEMGVCATDRAAAPDRQICVSFFDGNLRAYVNTGPVELFATIPYDPIAARYWAVSEAAGSVRWELSPDGIDWTVLDAMPVAFSIERMQFQLVAGTFGAATTPGIARYGRVLQPTMP